MTLDEAIKHAEEVAEENQRVVDTGIVFDDVTIDMLYCDDTEVIDEHLANYQMCAKEHRQLAEWLKDYKRLLEQEPCEDKRLYIKVFADLEPDDIAEKIYQICDEDKFPKVIESLKEYFDSEPCEDCISRLIVQEEISKSIALKENSHQMYKRIQAIPSVTPQPFINKPCVSKGVCREDKIQVLDKIRAEIENVIPKAKFRTGKTSIDVQMMIPQEKVLQIIDKYKAESEDKE